MAVLTSVNARNAHFRNAVLAGADLSNADLGTANFRGADMSGAKLIAQDLNCAALTDALIDGASFLGQSPVDLPERPDIVHSAVRRARIGAKLKECDLEDMELPEAEFLEHNSKGQRLTGSRMPRPILPGPTCRRRPGRYRVGRGEPVRCKPEGLRFHLRVQPQRISGQPDCQRRQPHRVLRRQLRPADLSAAGGNSQGQSYLRSRPPRRPYRTDRLLSRRSPRRQVHSGPVRTLAPLRATSFSTGREGTSH